MNNIMFELIEKNKKNSRISAADRELLENTLFDELSKGVYEDDIEKVLCEGPADSTMKALSLYLNSIEAGDANVYLRKLVFSNRIQENKGGASGTRMVFLVASLIDNVREQNKLIEFAFTTMVWFAYKKENDGFNKKVVEQIRNIIFPIFDTKDSIIDLHFIEKDKNWYRVRDLFIEAMLNLEKTSFGRVQKIYYWLKSSGRNMGKYTEEYVTKITLEQTQNKHDDEINNNPEKKRNVVSSEQERLNPDDAGNACNDSHGKELIDLQTERPNQQEISEPKKRIDTVLIKKEDDKKNRVISEIVSIVLAEYELHKSMREEIDTLSKEIADMQVQINKLLGREEQQRAYIQELVTEKRTLTAENTADEGEIKELTELVEKLKCEIDDRKQFTDTVARNREKQSEEQLNKLASKLRVDYRDFCDAKDIDMTIDLGENMREQLGAVFSILEKNGIKLS